MILVVMLQVAAEDSALLAEINLEVQPITRALVALEYQTALLEQPLPMVAEVVAIALWRVEQQVALVAVALVAEQMLVQQILVLVAVARLTVQQVAQVAQVE